MLRGRVGNEKVVVVGATGQQGGAVVECLARRGQFQIVGLTRTPQSEVARKVTVPLERADLLEPASLDRVLAGVHGVFGVTQPWTPGYKKVDAPGEIQQGKNLIDACKRAGVKHLVLSTAMQVDGKPTGIPHLDSKQDIERHLHASGFEAFTLLRPGTFMENIGLPFFPVKKGKLRGFVDGDAKLPFMSAHDVGEAAAVAFCGRETWLGKTVDLVSDYVSGDEIVSYLQAAHPERKWRYTCVPRLLMRLFAREFYRMRVGAEEAGRPPFPHGAKVNASLAETRAMVPGWKSVRKYIEALPVA